MNFAVPQWHFALGSQHSLAGLRLVLLLPCVHVSPQNAHAFSHLLLLWVPARPRVSQRLSLTFLHKRKPAKADNSNACVWRARARARWKIYRQILNTAHHHYMHLVHSPYFLLCSTAARRWVHVKKGKNTEKSLFTYAEIDISSAFRGPWFQFKNETLWKHENCGCVKKTFLSIAHRSYTV